MNKIIFLTMVLLFSGCEMNNSSSIQLSENPEHNYSSVTEIPLPPGYKRMIAKPGSFADWLRQIPLREDNNVYLYNGSLKKNQSAQFAVLDISVGKKDLQQCADAVMRLRAEYLFDNKMYNEISFSDNNGKKYNWAGGADRPGFEKYLETVFAWCGSASLEKQLKPINDLQHLMPGDVLIKGGFPGHAMMVVDVAVNNAGQKIFMLAQSFMPAQDIHIVINPLDKKLSPWYKISKIEPVITPEYRFSLGHLRTW